MKIFIERLLSVIVYRTILIVNKCYHGGGRRLRHFFSQRWAYTYMKSRGVTIPSRKEIMLYGNIDILIEKGAKVSIGKGFICRSGFREAIDNSCGSKIHVKADATLRIGECSGMSNTTIHCHNSITIGNYVNIGAGCMIFDTNFHSSNWKHRADRSTDCRNATSAPITIGDHVFIGARSIICKGVNIGNRSMIAAGSIVVRDIPDDELWGGNPARFIKRLNTFN